MNSPVSTGPPAGDLPGRFAAALMPTYGVPALALVRGEGCHVFDTAGRRYLDLVAGIAVSALGHAHPAVVAAVSRQVATLAHTSNLYLHEPEVRLAERLLEVTGLDGRVFFANSGTEANEAAIKVVRRAAGAGRDHVVAFAGAFHGRSRGSLALTGKAAIRDPFGPFGLDVRFLPYGDVPALAEAVTPRCAAVFVEPALGEGGVVVPPPGFLAAVRRACSDAGALLVVDEVQSGIGRTGDWLACRREDVRPDVVTLAKGLGGGLPIGACIGVGRYGTVLGQGDHGSTFGGNPVACAAALAVLDTIERDHLLARAAAVGRALAEGIEAVRHPLVRAVRGRGLWLGVALTRPVAGTVEAAAREAGFLVNAVRPDTVRLAPPLILTPAEAATFVTALPSILAAAAGADPAGDPAGDPAAARTGSMPAGTPPATRTTTG